MPSLVPCDCCGRHVRYVEPICPFCAAPLPLSLQRRASSARPSAAAPAGRRLGRAATFALGAAALATTMACGDDDGSVVPLYGAPADAGSIDGGRLVDAGGSTDSGAADAGGASDAGMETDSGMALPDGAVQEDGGGIVPLYGAPAVDGGIDRLDSGMATRDGGGGIMPLYGAPPE